MCSSQRWCHQPYTAAPQVVDLAEVVRLVKQEAGPQARVVADGVAFAPHLPMDVSAWGVDWCALSAFRLRLHPANPSVRCRL